MIVLWLARLFKRAHAVRRPGRPASPALLSGLWYDKGNGIDIVRLTNYASSVKQISRRLAAGVLLVLVCAGILGGTALADSYGAGSYNTCPYNAECGTAVPPVTLPDGLKVTINLSNGQVIPRSGYEIVITALNGGTDASFKNAKILIGDTEAQTITPDSSQTARWKWDPAEYPGTRVTIIITQEDGRTSTFEYTVGIGDAEASGSGSDSQQNGGQPGGSQAKPTGANWVLETIAGFIPVPEGVKQIFRNLPPIIINTFPYLLFVLLALVCVVVLLQIKRELAANRTLLAIIEQEKLMLELKKNFLGLSSHYLRTPLAIIEGSVDTLALIQKPVSAAVASLQTAVMQLREHIMAIIAEEEAVPVAADVSRQKRAPIRIGVWTLIVLAAAGGTLFNLVAYRSGRTLLPVAVMTQAAAFILVSLVLYQVERRFMLHRRERKIHDNTLQMQRELQVSRDNFLKHSATQLSEDYNTIRNLTAQLPADPATQSLRDGVTRFYEVVARYHTARLLQGGHSTQDPVVTSVIEVINLSQPDVQKLLDAKHLQVVPPADAQLTLQEPALVEYVTRSLLDNAIAYSPEGGTITVAAERSDSSLELSVSDQGKGIAKDRQQLLFQPLSRTEGYEDFTHQGMGFSLYLDKLIMDYLGGTISIDSEEGKGTTLRIEVPLHTGIVG